MTGVLSRAIDGPLVRLLRSAISLTSCTQPVSKLMMLICRGYHHWLTAM
jgi:hypothetical protein